MSPGIRKGIAETEGGREPWVMDSAQWVGSLGTHGTRNLL